MTEEWRPTRFPGYEASSEGRIRSLDRLDGRGHRISGRILRPGLRDKYLVVCPCVDGKQTTVRLHNLILETFRGLRPESYMVARHWNDNRMDNSIGNLYWGTRSDNEFDKVRNGNHHMASRTHCVWGHLLSEPNLVPSMLRRGHRNCLACARAKSHLRRHPDFDFREISNHYYEGIMT